MSDTGKKLDVEDVLSSIRRLVSEEARTPDAAEEADGDAENKLVLTPSLRVPGDEKPKSTSEIEQRISDIESLVTSELRAEAPEVDLNEASPGVEAAAMFAQLSDKMSVQSPEESEPTDDDLGVLEVSSLDMPDEDFAEKLRAFSAKSENVQADPTNDPVPEEKLEQQADPELRTEPALKAEPESSRPLEPVLEAEPYAEPNRVSEPEMVMEAPSLAVPQPVFEAEPVKEPDASTMEDVDEAPMEEVVEQFADDDFPSDSPFQANYDLETPPEPEFASQASADPEVEEAAFTPSFDPKPEPPLKAPVIERADLMDATDPVLETQETAQEEPPLSAAMPVDGFDLTSDDGSQIDEDMLREIVSDMVRSELQGELGDRITRNVRKLVRREIHRALASRDFE
ncbi:MAG: hypothetical protein AAF393_11455 [Pseudomonadota bacterium]